MKLHGTLENGREEEANKIQEITRGENQRRNWISIAREMCKTRALVPTMVETVDKTGTVPQHRTKDGMERAIHN